MFTIVSASTQDERDFHDNTFLGRCLSRLHKSGVEFDLLIYPHNSVGLSELYNRAIDEDRSEQPMVLIHDDVSIEDMLIDQKLCAALRQFDIVGTAGGDPPTEVPGWCNPKWPIYGYVPHANPDQLESILYPKMSSYAASPHASN